MGFGSYTLPDGREAGYSIEAVCDEPGCTEVIDRGLAYLCGNSPLGHGLEVGCGGYFCSEHLWLCGAYMPDGRPVSACSRCCADEDEPAHSAASAGEQ